MPVRFIPTKEQQMVVEVMIAGGIPYETIRQTVINPHTNNPIGIQAFQRAFKEQIARGGAAATQKVIATMFKMATSGQSPASTMFWLKCRCQWREVHRHEHVDPHGRPLGADPILTARQLAKMTEEEVEEILRKETADF